jgi:hypothetical protein
VTDTLLPWLSRAILAWWYMYRAPEDENECPPIATEADESEFTQWLRAEESRVRHETRAFWAAKERTR